MDQTLIKQKLEQWLIEFVEQPNPLLNDWPPCPYARQARLDNKIYIVFDTPLNIKNYFEFLTNYDVVVLCFDHRIFTSDFIEEYTKQINKEIVTDDLVILEDHPNSEEHINGVKMNFDECGLLVLQSLSKLTSAADQLRKKGYYNVWSQKNLDDVVNWRSVGYNVDIFKNKSSTD